VRPSGAPPLYRPRSPRQSPLYQLLDAHYERVKDLWDERFERRYGFWRGRWDTAVARFLDCRLFEPGFARIVCPSCRAELLVAFSCKGRGLCPSCGAKRAALFAELLQQHVLADVPHAQWVFSMPKMLRPCFLYHRQILGDLSRLAFDTVLQLMAEAVDEPRARPSMVAAYKRQIEKGLEANPREANKARVILRDLLGPIQMCPGEDGSLWAEFDARPAALLKKAAGTSVGSGGSGGLICTYRHRVE